MRLSYYIILLYCYTLPTGGAASPVRGLLLILLYHTVTRLSYCMILLYCYTLPRVYRIVLLYYCTIVLYMYTMIMYICILWLCIYVYYDHVYMYTMIMYTTCLLLYYICIVLWLYYILYYCTAILCRRGQTGYQPIVNCDAWFSIDLRSIYLFLASGYALKRAFFDRQRGKSDGYLLGESTVFFPLLNIYNLDF